MKIAFRHVPFTPAQRAELDALCAGYGCQTLWCAPDQAPDAALLADCDALMGYYPTELLAKLPRLRWLQVPCAGVERYCAGVFADDSVVLTNCAGAFGVAIAEYMVTGLLMLMRLMPAYMANQREKVWRCMGECRSIYGSVITVVGMGDIGRRFAHVAKAMGATVRGVRRSPAAPVEDFDEVYTSADLARAVEGADAVALCLPATAQTRGMVSRKVLARMRPDALLVNCGRGVTVDEAALVEALQQGRLGGAVLDVAAVEPLPADSPLWSMPNVIVTPHISGHDDDPVNYQFIFGIFRDNLQRFLTGQPLQHVVDRTRGY